MLTKNELDEIRTRCEAATSAPWFVSPDFDVWYEEYMEVCAIDYNSNMKDDASFIAYARRDVPALLDDVERLLAALRQAELGCLHPTDGRTVGGFDPGRGPYTVVRCWVCRREIRIYVKNWERVGKHADGCAFAGLEGGDTFAQKERQDNP